MLRNVACASRNIRERSSACGKKSSSSTRLSARLKLKSKNSRDKRRADSAILSKKRRLDSWLSTPLFFNSITLRLTRNIKAVSNVESQSKETDEIYLAS